MTLTTGAALLTAGDLAVKTRAVQALADGHAVDLGLLQLRLAYNPGVAFSFGATLPSWVVLTATGLITAGLERTRKITTVLLDKTGTLTRAQMSLTSIVTGEGIDEDELLRRAGALEANSEHPSATPSPWPPEPASGGCPQRATSTPSPATGYTPTRRHRRCHRLGGSAQAGH